MTGVETVLLESFRSGEYPRTFLFRDPQEVIEAVVPSQVLPALRLIEEKVGGGLHAAGFVSYEAASGFDPRLTTRAKSDLPLLRFGLYSRREEVVSGGGSSGNYMADGWQQTVDRVTHATAMAKIRDFIASGDTYQVNFTFRKRFRFQGDSFAFYRALCTSQRTAFSAFIDTGRWQILSASPELFFSLKDGVITTRPMKGTATRGPGRTTRTMRRRNSSWRVQRSGRRT